MRPEMSKDSKSQANANLISSTDTITTAITNCKEKEVLHLLRNCKWKKHHVQMNLIE